MLFSRQHPLFFFELRHRSTSQQAEPPEDRVKGRKELLPFRRCKAFTIFHIQKRLCPVSLLHRFSVVPAMLQPCKTTANLCKNNKTTLVKGTKRHKFGRNWQAARSLPRLDDLRSLFCRFQLQSGHVQPEAPEAEAPRPQRSETLQLT